MNCLRNSCQCASTTASVAPERHCRSQAAASWFRAGAEQGQADAQHNLALLHRQGLGVPQDFAEAYQWWSLAAGGGHAVARDQRELLVKQMTEAQLAEGQRRLQATELRLPRKN